MLSYKYSVFTLFIDVFYSVDHHVTQLILFLLSILAESALPRAFHATSLRRNVGFNIYLYRFRVRKHQAQKLVVFYSNIKLKRWFGLLSAIAEPISESNSTVESIIS